MTAGAVLAHGAAAATVDVLPGPGALGAAVAAAEPGDELLVHPGTYSESIVVDKPLQIVGLRDGPRPVIDGGCSARVTVAVTVGGVSLRWLKVIGADESGGFYPSSVDFTGVSSGSARELKLVDTCEAEYGINVFQTGAVSLLDNEAVGFSDAGIYVGAISDTGGSALRVSRNSTHGNNRGLIVEDSGGSAVDIRLRRNVADRNRLIGEGNPTGIFIRNTDGILIEGNRARHNGRFGLQLDAESDHNHLFDNIFAHNPSDDVSDSGRRNCGTGNVPDLSDCG
ncbi:MAG: NosD domain-containing protein [Vicinamibacteria bacterium]